MTRVELNLNQSNVPVKYILTTVVTKYFTVTRTRYVHNRQGRHPPLYKDLQGLDDGCVRVDEGYVLVGADAQLPQGLLHKGWLGHLAHLEQHNTARETLSVALLTFSNSKGSVQVKAELSVYCFKTDSFSYILPQWDLCVLS